MGGAAKGLGDVAIEKAEIPLPVANILDRFEPYTELAVADFVFVDAGAPATDQVNFAAYDGPRPYTRETAQWILDTEVRNAQGEVITTAHFIASFRAQDHMEPSRLRAMYQDMEGAVLGACNEQHMDEEGCLFHLGGATEDRYSLGRKTDFIKGLMLAMQGSWLTAHSYSWRCVDTNHRDDVPGQVTKFRHLQGLHHPTVWCSSGVVWTCSSPPHGFNRIDTLV